MEAVVLAEVTMAGIVLCADGVAEDGHRPWGDRIARALCWPLTLLVWFTHRSMAKLTRFGAIVWFLVISGWLLALVGDHTSSATAFLLLAEAAMGFVVASVDSMSADLRRHPWRRLGRSVVWPKPVLEYVRADDSVRLVQASVVVWVTLTCGWLVALEADHLSGWLRWLPG